MQGAKVRNLLNSFDWINVFALFKYCLISIGDGDSSSKSVNDMVYSSLLFNKNKVLSISYYLCH